jgi:hypothetical protein
MPHKFSHIKSLRDIDDEIMRTELKKSIIRNDISLRVSNVREMLKPASLGWQLVKLILPRNGENSASSILIKTALEVLTTVEASKFGWKLLKRIFR